jgi:hypothetical protein
MKLLSGTLWAPCVIGLTAFICLVAPAHGQNPQITADANVDSGMLQTWLKSGDPRLIAWAADFARRRHDADLISEIQASFSDGPQRLLTRSIRSASLRVVPSLRFSTR